jgi:lipase chaperone LimK
MTQSTGTRLTIGAIVGGVALIALALSFWPRGAAPETGSAAGVATPAWTGPVGPGLASGAPAPAPAPASAPTSAPPGANPAPSRTAGLTLDAGGHLLLDRALRTLFDSYLVRASATQRPARAEQLRTLLKRELAAPALDEADRIVARYLDYLATEERLLVRERFAAPGPAGLSERDVAQLLAWQEQRAQQRARLLGTTLAEAWFEADDTRCLLALHDWQLQHVAPGAGQELDPAEARERRLHGAALEAMRDADAQGCAAQLRGVAGGGQ